MLNVKIGVGWKNLLLIYNTLGRKLRFPWMKEAQFVTVMDIIILEKEKEHV